MNIKYLSSFLTAADEGSINMAASRLYVTPSALMKRINSIEEEVGVTLLRRGKKGIELTQAGEVFSQGLRTLIPEYEDLLQKTREADRSSSKAIVIGSWSVACHTIIPQVTNYYHLRRPDANLIFRNISGIGKIKEALEKKEIDITFSYGGPCLATAGLRCETLAKEAPVLLIPPTCDMPVHPGMTLDDFDGRVLVATDGSCSGWFEGFNRYVTKCYPSIRLHRTVENESGLMDMQTLGAPCVGSRSIIPRDSNYVSVPLELPADYREPYISIDLLTRNEKNPLVEDFIGLVREAAKIIWFNR